MLILGILKGIFQANGYRLGEFESLWNGLSNEMLVKLKWFVHTLFCARAHATGNFLTVAKRGLARVWRVPYGTFSQTFKRVYMRRQIAHGLSRKSKKETQKKRGLPRGCGGYTKKYGIPSRNVKKSCFLEVLQ